MGKLYAKVNSFNEWLAVHATIVFGSMWMTYVFFMYGFLPLMFPNDMDKLLYWSNTVQLWSLPLLMVGQNVMGRASEKRAQQDHETLMAEFEILKENDKLQHEEIVLQREEIARLKHVEGMLILLLKERGIEYAYQEERNGECSSAQADSTPN